MAGGMMAAECTKGQDGETQGLCLPPSGPQPVSPGVCHEASKAEGK